MTLPLRLAQYRRGALRIRRVDWDDCAIIVITTALVCLACWWETVGWVS